MQYKVVRDDISKFPADAVVLPSNPKLKEGSGTSTAIFEKAGKKELDYACKFLVKKYGSIQMGCSIPTPAYKLDATYIIHTVIPKWKDGNHNEYEYLSSAYYSSLREADILKCRSIAIPLLGTGMNGFSLETSFDIADTIIRAYKPDNDLAEVYLIVYGRRAVDLMRVRNIPVTENIDAAYELGKDEKYRAPVVKAMRYLQDQGQLFLDDAIKLCQEKIEDPEFRKEMLEKAGMFAADIIREMIAQEKHKRLKKRM